MTKAKSPVAIVPIGIGFAFNKWENKNIQTAKTKAKRLLPQIHGLLLINVQRIIIAKAIGFYVYYTQSLLTRILTRRLFLFYQEIAVMMAPFIITMKNK